MSEDEIEILESDNVYALPAVEKIKKLVKFNYLKKTIKLKIFKMNEPEIDWEVRAEQSGAHSVLDSRHSIEEFDYVTQKQKDILFPYLQNQLNGKEKNLLDFGCGPGRFTADLAKIVNGYAIGYDPTKLLIDLCKPAPNTLFTHDLSEISASHMPFDVIWICLVLGGMPHEKVMQICSDLESKLSDHGLLFLIESTGQNFIDGSWRVRTTSQYKKAFSSIKLEVLGKYLDAGQEISIFAGRKD